MTTLENLIENVLSNTNDAERVMLEFLPFEDGKIIFSIGFIEEVLNWDLPRNSKEARLLDKIYANSYDFHRLDENLEYVHAENEHR